MFAHAKRPEHAPPASGEAGNGRAKRPKITPPPTRPLYNPFARRPLEAPSGPVQRKEACACAGMSSECPTCQKKDAPMLERPPTSAQMRRGAPSEDPAERQADEIGKKIADDLSGTESIGHGPLPKSLQQIAEAHLGVSVEGTYLDAGGSGQKKAKEESALAVTEGRHVAFGEGQLDTMSREGRELLGHELVHVGQQQVAGNRVLQKQLSRERLKPESVEILLRQYGGSIKKNALAFAPPDAQTLIRLFPFRKNDEKSGLHLPIKTNDETIPQRDKLVIQLKWDHLTKAAYVQEGGMLVAVNVGIDLRDGGFPSEIAKFTGSNYWRKIVYLLGATVAHEFMHVSYIIYKRYGELGASSPAGDLSSAVKAAHTMLWASEESEYAQVKGRIVELSNRLHRLCGTGQPTNEGQSLACGSWDPGEMYEYLVHEWAVTKAIHEESKVGRHDPNIPPDPSDGRLTSSAHLYAIAVADRLIPSRNSTGLYPAPYKRMIDSASAELMAQTWELYKKLNADIELAKLWNRTPIRPDEQ